MSIDVREALSDESAGIEALLQGQFEGHQVRPPADALRAAIARVFARPDLGRFVVAAENGTLIGVAYLAFTLTLEHGGRAAWLEELYVEEARRGRGVGSALLREACSLAQREGARAVDLEVEVGHERAEALYVRHGFVRRARQHWSLALAVTDGPLTVDAAQKSSFQNSSVQKAGLRTGGCLCGSVRYAVRAAPIDVSHCHCGTCRRATGAPFVTWATFPAAGFAFTGEAPAERRSSPQAVRTFCAGCGTALTFREEARPRSVDVTVGSLDAPESVAPIDHAFCESRLPFIRLADGLPVFARSNPDEVDAPAE